MSARLREGALGLLPILGLVGIWQAVVSLGLAPPALLPAPGTVLARCLAQFANPEFLGHAGATLSRLAVGFLAALVLGVGIGILAAASPGVLAVVRPLVRVLAPVPKVALYPAFILTLGFADASKIALVVADAVFPILLATLQGAAMVEPKLVWAARAAGTSPRAALLRVVLPATLPSILTGARIGLVVSCIVVFLAEMITSTDGLGYLLVRAARSFQTVDMFVPLIAISGLGLLLNGALGLARGRLLRGFPEEG
ncbi:ABC transporter permease [Methylobacterium crusticola]|uniref:ABC transporter permease n=1 Tax=Methylobacterium crusticola TaxID=1697972 RepID=UPI000FFC13D6|nr:ABC transporter permease subunit [Methylobacterium crusticola]